MTVQVFSATRHIAGRAVLGVIRRGALAAIAAGLGMISVGAYGAELETGYSRAVPVPTRSAPAVRRSTPARPIDLPYAEPNRSVQRAVLVDQLYDELMRTSACSLGSGSTGAECRK